MSAFANRSTRLVGALVLGVGILAGTAACSGSADPAAATAEHTITVTSSAEVQVVPDKASIGVDIQAEGPTPEEAEQANVKITNAVIAALKELDINEADIQTTYTDLSPTWYAEDDDESYQMQTRLTVGNLAIEDVAAVMDACIAAGATGVDGPDYTTGSYDDAYQEALVAAVEAARPKAEAIAEAGEVTLDSVVNVVEGYQNVTYRDSNAVATEAAADTLMDIEPGQVTISAEVTVTYAIK